jgi:hypothetical protein
MTRVSSFYILISKNLLYFLKISSFLILAIATGHCQSAEEKAKEIVRENEARAKANALSYKGNACPNYGILKPEEIKQATYTDNDGSEKIFFIVKNSSEMHSRGKSRTEGYNTRLTSQATGALKIGSRLELDEFTKNDYFEVCGDENALPYWDEIAYNIEVKKIIAAMASSLKIKPSEILDLRRPTRFRPAWFNSRENPSIDNQMSYYDNEFKFQEEKESFKKIREYKYVITDDYILSGDYDFEQNGYHLTTEDSEYIQYNQSAYFAPQDLRFPTDVIFKISPQKAQKFKSRRRGLNAIILSKIFSKIHLVNTEGHPRREGKDKNAKIKYFSIETLKYHIEFENEIYKNY